MKVDVTRRVKPHLIVPEVIQTSAMDCGPGSLKCLLEGFGINVSYGRLREACQTDVDGTSIDTVEEVAVQLGLQAEQIMLPADYMLLDESDALPAIVVVRQPNGLTHFVVAWRRHGSFVQVMDPAIGRQWLTREQFVSSVYVHTMPVPQAAWLEWARSERFLAPLRRKFADLGVAAGDAATLINHACSSPEWLPIATLEAATRTVQALVHPGSVRRGSEAHRVLRHLLKQSSSQPEVIPSHYYSVSPAPAGPDGEEQLLLRGAVLVRVSRIQQVASAETAPEHATNFGATTLSRELRAALEEPPSRPAKELARMLLADGLLKPVAIVSALLLATFGVLVQTLLFRTLLEMPRSFAMAGQRMSVMAVLIVFMVALLLLEVPLSSGLLRMGRQLENRLRVAFLMKIPRLGDRYFQSRLTSDMAERSHSSHRLRTLPELGGRFVRTFFELTMTVAGIIWLDTQLAIPAIVVAAASVALPLVAQPLLSERDLRLRNHSGALSRFYLDSLLGLMPVRTHGAERSLRREHEGLLTGWARAGYSLQNFVVCLEGVQQAIGLVLAAWLLISHFSHASETGGVLLLVYWALNLPALGQQFGQIAWQYPAQRNVTLRALEPLGALEERAATCTVPVAAEPDPTTSFGIRFERVSVRAAGHTILHDVDLAIEPGSHVAIVGPSGAGKSSLVGVLLGWHQPSVGRVLIDGEPLHGEALDRLRRETAWIDPAVQLWNRSLFDNLRYGAADALPTAELLEKAGLRDVLPRLPEGLQTMLGEGGALLSGGEGQRVRLARAMLKRDVRLAILDEPFRGLDRQKRRELLARARQHWQGATLLCVTHDVGETLAFERVLIVDGGRVVEDGAPLELASQPESRYRAMLEAEDAVRETMWASDNWRHLRLDDGNVTELSSQQTEPGVLQYER